MTSIEHTGQGVGRLLGEGVGVLRRYGSDGGQRLLDQLRTNRNLLRFAAKESLHPLRLNTATRAYGDALARQRQLFAAEHADDVTDAMRHANASALVVDRIARRGTKLDVAADFMRRLGRAHERDSQLTGSYRAASELMDLHNNELGISLAVEHARRGASSTAGEQALEGAVLRALREGRALVLDSPASLPRASTAAELDRALRR